MKPPRPYTVETVYLEPPPEVAKEHYVAGYRLLIFGQRFDPGRGETEAAGVFGPFDESVSRARCKSLNNAYAKGWEEGRAGQMFREAGAA